MRARILAPLLIVMAGCSVPPPSPGTEIQAVLDEYAPDLRIGGRVSPQARERYRLSVAPYMGYSDSTYVAPDGLRGLGIKVNEYVDDGNPRVSRRARIASVHLGVWDTASFQRALTRLRARLGEPERLCRRSPDVSLTSYFWSGEAGLGVLAGLRTRGDSAEVARYGIGGISFGVEPLRPVSAPWSDCSTEP